VDDLICIEPTIIRWTGAEHEEEVVAHIRGDSAEETVLLVFCSEEEAEDFRSAVPKFSEAEGFTVEAVDHYELARIVGVHRFPQIAMPKSWGEKGILWSSSWSFLQMLGDLPRIPSA
jgi:hypothetical protein